MPGTAGPPQETGRPLAGAHTLTFLSGDWNVVRRISDHRTGTDGEFRGTASFRLPSPGAVLPEHLAGLAAGQVLEYREHGELTFGSHRGPAGRSLLYSGRPDGTADVWFADGRAFFLLDLRGGSWQAVHPCREDQYLVTVTRLDGDSFAETWQVAGPAKDYTMTASYVRADAGDRPCR